jgi:hypothetical protein
LPSPSIFLVLVLVLVLEKAINPIQSWMEGLTTKRPLVDEAGGNEAYAPNPAPLIRLRFEDEHDDEHEDEALVAPL